MSTIRVYCRCNGGHYFIGEYCPYDGWSSAAARELVEATARREKAGKEPTLNGLRKLGVSSEALWRTAIICFGTSASIFDAIAPDTFVVNGETKPPHKLGLGFK